MKSFRLGLFAEYIVMLVYFALFYKILGHRYKTYVGEIDIIASRGNDVVFIEVKARKYGIHGDIISEKQKQRITRAAELFLSQNHIYQKCNLRFDFVLIRPYRLPLIIKNAW